MTTDNFTQNSIGLSGKRGFISLRRVLAPYLKIIQRPSFYRKVARLARFAIEIKEANEKDMRKVHCWLSPGIEYKVYYANNVTNFIAKNKDKIIGFVQLVRRFEEDSCYKGHWLFSLTTRFMYRRMGVGESLTNSVI